MKPVLCTLCCDADITFKFQCKTVGCDYRLCNECLLVAFADPSGQNSRLCPFCKVPTAIDMAVAQIGRGGVSAVEQELRPTVEHQVRKEMDRKEARKQAASETNDKAIKLYNQIAENLNLKCPRCKMPFDDYEGCNALKCGNDLCCARFCAICLQDCGRDAHPHVREKHGNLYDKEMFVRSKREREKQLVESFLDDLRKQDEPFELVQQVSNLLEKVSPTDGNENDTGAYNFVADIFVQDAKDDLESMIRSDRLSVLKSEELDVLRHGITRDNISPRCVIPENIIINLVPTDAASGEFMLEIFVEVGNNQVRVDPDGLTEMMEQGRIPKTTGSSVMNIKRSLNCAVIALEGERCLYQTRKKSDSGPEALSLTLHQVDIDGAVVDQQGQIFGSTRILAMNSNHRLKLLQTHVENNINPENLPNPLKNLIGIGKPTSVFTELTFAIGDQLERLNQEQLNAAHPLQLKTAREVAGPPGTGKTQVITALVQCLLHCTDKNIVVLSERNGAIDAVAEKFVKSCFEMRRGKMSKVSDVDVWRSIVTYGAAEAMGTNTKQFLFEEKMKWHPDLLEAQKIEKNYRDQSDNHAKTMRDAISDEVRTFSDEFDDDNAWSKHVKIQRNSANELRGPTDILYCLRETGKGLEDLMRQDITEDKVRETVLTHSTILDNLFALPRKDEIRFGTKGEDFWHKREIIRRSKYLSALIKKLLDSELFEEDTARQYEQQVCEAQESRQKVEVRVRKELETNVRLRMSTIGSSHKLFDSKEVEQDEDEIDEVLPLVTTVNSIEDLQNTIIIFDESGCIPSYELLGLSRLDCDIDSIFVVGDKHQLPPYDPSSNSDRRGGRNTKDMFSRRKSSSSSLRKKVRSILDVSKVDEIKLKIQYRVPRDIADILNARIYNGNYNTLKGTHVPDKGINFEHVPYPREPARKKYVNMAEVEKVLSIVREKMFESRSGSGEGIMILTPYKNQQREIQYQMKRRSIGFDEDRILTIDQCQGQEADTVIFTLVQRPTRFLNKNRMTVAISRTRKELIIVGDRDDFLKQSQKSDWECSYIAQDILFKS